MNIIRWLQSFTAGSIGVELHQMRKDDFAAAARSHILCQDLIGRTGRRKVTMSMLDARRHFQHGHFDMNDRVNSDTSRPARS